MSDPHDPNAPAPDISGADVKKKPGRPRKAEITAALSLDDEAFLTLREQSRLDPPMGVPMKWPNDRGEMVDIEPGRWMDPDHCHRLGVDIVDPVSGLPKNLPIQALGLNGLVASFLNTLGQKVDLKGDSGKGVFELLFAGRTNYLIWLFPRYTQKGIIEGWHADHLKRALWDWVGWTGGFDEAEQVRGRGLWRDGKGGAVYHAGNAVLIDGKWVRPGRYGNYIYSARGEIGRPKAMPEVDSVGRQCLEILKTWNWDRPGLDPIMQLGWVMTAKLGAVLHRRPVVWVTGPRGSGKSYLQGFVRGLMHEAVLASSGTTAAGIYGKLQRDCIPVMVDEQEAKADTRVTDRLLDIIRVSYSGDEINRGKQDGGSVSYVLRSSFLCSSIAKPAMESSDDSRMALLSIKPIEDLNIGKSYDLAEAYRLGQALTQRCLDWVPRLDGLIEIIETAMRTSPGHSARSLETFGPLAAGFHMALFDDMPTIKQLARYAEWFAPENLGELKSQTDDWEKCIRHLLGVMPEHMKNNAKKTIGAVLAPYCAGIHDTALHDVEESLKGFRLCVTFRKGVPETLDQALLFIPNIDPVLVDMFKDTSWVGRKGNAGAWNGVLRQAPKALWEDYSSTKGGLGAVRGVAFKLKALVDYLSADHETVATAVIDLRGADPEADDAPWEDSFGSL